MIEFKLLHPRATHDMLGLIPTFLSERDPRSAKEQLDTNYAHGGGWRSFEGFTFNHERKTIHYPGDPVYPAIAEAKLRDETIILFQFAWVMVLQADGSYEIARMD